MKVYKDIPEAVILSAVEKLYNYIKVTYGPAGRGILIQKANGSPEILDDGYAALEEFQLEDELENLVVDYIKQASQKTNRRAGDGTTTSLVITYAIVSAVMEMKKNGLTRVDVNAIARELRAAAQVAIGDIKKASRNISTKEDLEKIAFNSYNNPEISKMIAEIVLEVGADGAVALEESDTLETTTEVVSGMKIDRGYTSPYLAGPNGEPIELKNPVIFLTDDKITSLDVLVPITDPWLKDGRKDFLIIAEEVSGEAMATLIVNRLQGRINIAVVKCPGYGEAKHLAMQDIATVTGAKYISEQVANRTIKSITKEDFGGASKVIVNADETIIVDGKGDKDEIEKRAETIRPLLDQGTKYDQERNQERLASLVGGIGVIRVGAPTEGEMRSIKSKAEDAISATKLAFKSGVVQGGGQTLAALRTGSELLDSALRKPRELLLANGADSLSDDAQDAAGVLIASLESAVSVAANLVTTGGLIAEKREEEDK
jgi:chaperonin GroEL